MNQRITLVRAISSEFIHRKFKSLLRLFVIVFTIALIGSAWTTRYNPWLWVVFTVLVIFSILFGSALVVARMLIRLLMPTLTAEQKAGVVGFVDKFERNMDNFGTPPLLIQFKILRDLIWTRKESFIRSATRDGMTLHKDFLELDKLFRD